MRQPCQARTLPQSGGSCFQMKILWPPTSCLPGLLTRRLEKANPNLKTGRLARIALRMGNLS